MRGDVTAPPRGSRDASHVVFEPCSRPRSPSRHDSGHPRDAWARIRTPVCWWIDEKRASIRSATGFEELPTANEVGLLGESDTQRQHYTRNARSVVFLQPSIPILRLARRRYPRPTMSGERRRTRQDLIRRIRAKDEPSTAITKDVLQNRGQRLPACWTRWLGRVHDVTSPRGSVSGRDDAVTHETSITAR